MEFRICNLSIPSVVYKSQNLTQTITYLNIIFKNLSPKKYSFCNTFINEIRVILFHICVKNKVNRYENFPHYLLSDIFITRTSCYLPGHKVTTVLKHNMNKKINLSLSYKISIEKYFKDFLLPKYETYVNDFV